nr:hypothetical protein [uncultured Butyrivibrio sp.]
MIKPENKQNDKPSGVYSRQARLMEKRNGKYSSNWKYRGKFF